MPQTILITGANRGIGFALTKHYLSQGENVIATCRNPDKAEALKALEKDNGNLSILPLDITDEKSIAALVAALNGKPLDVLINNAGILSGVDPKLQATESDPSQIFGSVNAQGLEVLLRVNVIAPIMVTQALLPNLKQSAVRKVIMISSGWGCITTMETETPPLGYGVSKSALNAAAKRIAIALHDDKVTVVSLTPGWVETEMGGNGADWAPDESAARMYKVIESLTFEQSGHYIKHSGEQLPW